eukprot:COSAG03_NODE_501_length_7408_cov_12.134218_5_plen_379_part_00
MASIDNDAGPAQLAMEDVLTKLRQDMEVRVQEVVSQQLQDKLSVDRADRADGKDVFDNPVGDTGSSDARSDIIGAENARRVGSILALGLPRSVFAAGASVCTRGSDPHAMDVDPKRRAYFVLGCLSVSVLQSMVMVGVYKGVSEPSCLTYKDCPDGFFCAHYTDRPGADVHSMNLGECTGCLGTSEETRNLGRHTSYCYTPAGESHDVCLKGWSNATEFCALANISEYTNGVDGCEACFDPSDPYHGDAWNKGRSEIQKVIDALAIMRGVDYLALVLVSIVVGLYVSSEWSDIKLCEILIAQRSNGDDPKWVKACFSAISSMRQFGFLPLLTATVVQLVAYRGSTALDICFNGVAIIFILEIECVSCQLLELVLKVGL